MSIVRSDHKVQNAAGISISGRRIGSRDGVGGGDYPALLLRVITRCISGVHLAVISLVICRAEPLAENRLQS